MPEEPKVGSNKATQPAVNKILSTTTPLLRFDHIIVAIAPKGSSEFPFGAFPPEHEKKEPATAPCPLSPQRW
jgi:hypothetical protein